MRVPQQRADARKVGFGVLRGAGHRLAGLGLREIGLALQQRGLGGIHLRADLDQRRLGGGQTSPASPPQLAVQRAIGHQPADSDVLRPPSGCVGRGADFAGLRQLDVGFGRLDRGLGGPDHRRGQLDLGQGLGSGRLFGEARLSSGRNSSASG